LPTIRIVILVGSFMLALLLTSLAAVSTFIGGWGAIRARRWTHLLLGFGAGALLGATFFDLLPEAISAANRRGWNDRTELGLLVIGFVIFYLAERFIEFHSRPASESKMEIRRHVGRLSAIGLIAHSMMDGASIAAATLVSWRTGLIVAIGIIAHDMSDGLNTMLLVTRGEKAMRKDYAFLLADAAAPVVGASIVLLSALSQQTLAIFLGITSGFFLFTATGVLLPDAHRRSQSFAVTTAMLFGILFLYVVVRMIGSGA
jgi:zinc transporter ZupT